MHKNHGVINKFHEVDKCVLTEYTTPLEEWNASLKPLSGYIWHSSRNTVTAGQENHL